MRKIDTLIIHCTATPEGRDVSVDTIRQWHVRDNKWSDIGYHYIIYRDGSVHLGRPVSLTGAHVSGHNSGSVGITYVGGCDLKMKPKDTRTDAQKASLRSLLIKLSSEFPIKKILGHTDLDPKKACPSFNAKSEYSDIVKGGA